jgi:autophagy-related protein 18
VHQFRRGSFSAAITSLSFDSTSTFLTVSSNSETVHIFKLKKLQSAASPEESAAAKGSSAVVAQYVLPTVVQEALEPERDFAHLKLPESSGKSVHIASMSSSLPQVMVATQAGSFYLFAVDLERGGECTLVKQFSLLT